MRPGQDEGTSEAVVQSTGAAPEADPRERRRNLLMAVPLVAGAAALMLPRRGEAFQAVRDAPGSTPVFDVYDVTDYGAVGDGQHPNEDTAGIQAAINAAFAARGGVVFFPPGEFNLNATIYVQRSTTIPIALVGCGPKVSNIHANPGVLSPTSPLLTFPWNPTGVSSDHFQLRDLSLSRSDQGPVFIFPQPTDTERMRFAVIQNVYFRQAPGGSADTIFIVGGLKSTLQNVLCYGGNTALHLRLSSHMTVINFSTEHDATMVNGIRLNGGGNHVLLSTRIEATSGGAGVSFENAVSNVLLDGLYFEGKLTNPQVSVYSARNVTLTNVALANAGGPGICAMRIYANATNVRVIGGTSGYYQHQAGALAFKVEAGAKFVRVEDVAMAESPASNIAIDPAASDVQFSVFHGAPASTRFKKSSLDQVTTLPYGAVITADAAKPSPARILATDGWAFTLANPTNAYAGAQLTFDIQNDSGGTMGTVSFGSAFRTAGAWINPAPGRRRLISFYFDGSAWIEVSRSSADV